MFFTGLLTVLLIWSHMAYVDCLECYSCNVSTVADCIHISSCPPQSICFADHEVNGDQTTFYLGCKPSFQCTNSSSSGQGHGSSLVGRAVQSGRCSECCDTNNCNRQLCQNPDPSCYDTANYDCASIGKTLNICGDKDHAKKNCQHYCGLCALVDGGWSAWGAWSDCDVTCDNGTQTRKRACTNPEPKAGGETCHGSKLEVKFCILHSCPVHGGWSQWSSWGSCSVSCDIGMQRRDRSCSNPFPSSHGNHCFGDARDDRICLPGPCSDGNWGQWESWSSCSRTCGDGLRSRSRHCDNPSPSVTGKDCAGSPEQTELCRDQKCADGYWGQWESWSSCSRTCGDGLRSRSRHCDNPSPSVTGKDCAGSPEQTESCRDQKCAANISAFTATNPSGSVNLTFENTILNEGNNYNRLNGKFVCSIPGLYFFALSLKGYETVQRTFYGCSVYLNGNATVSTLIRPDTHGYYEASTFVTLDLNSGDTVYPGSCNNLTNLQPHSTFSGFLISSK